MNFNFGFDIIFLSIIAASTVGSFFLGEEKSQRIMIGTVIGIAASTQLTDVIEKLIGAKNIEYSGVGIGIILLVLPIILCTIGKNVRDSKYPKSKIKAAIAGFISAFAFVGYALEGLASSFRDKLVTEHNLAALSYDLRFVALGLLILWIFVMYLTVGKAKK